MTEPDIETRDLPGIKPGDLVREKATGKTYRVLGARDNNLWLIWVDSADSVELTVKTRVGWTHDFTRYTKPLQAGDLVAYPTHNQIALLHALTSGEYEQGDGSLRRPGDKFCCLGVACDTYTKETGEGRWNDDKSFRLDDKSSTVYLPPEVAEWLDIPFDWRGEREDNDYDPVLVALEDGDEEEIEVRASILNDNGASFNVIADLFAHLFEHGKPREMNLDEYRTVTGYQGDISDLV